MCPAVANVLFVHERKETSPNCIEGEAVDFACVLKIMAMSILLRSANKRLRRHKKTPGCVLLAIIIYAVYMFALASLTKPTTNPSEHDRSHVRGVCLTPHSLNVSCEKLANRSGVYKHADKKLSTSCTQRPLEELLNTCDDLKVQHGYFWWPVTGEERDFPLAFGIKVHEKPHIAERLLRVIWRPHNFYCIHVDKKTPDDVFAVFQKLADCFHNVFLTDVRIRLVYASIFSLMSDIECMKMALRSNVSWKYYLNLSGQEFPLKTNFEIVQILSLLNGTNDIPSHPPAANNQLYYRRKHVIINEEIYQTQREKPPFAYKIVHRKGSAYGAFSRPFLQVALTDRLAVELLDWLNDTWAPDELFWSTLNYLPGYPGGLRADVSHEEGTFLSRALAWYWDKYRCQGHYRRLVCVFGSGDLPWLVRRPELIANKFDEDTDPVVVDCLEKMLEERAIAAFRGKPLPAEAGGLNWTFYRSSPHVRKAAERAR
ncbi:hypothetical protein BaRGS_00019501 [Batillaria attramentaria]|uniref:Beta-1,3-galactosyl-O-glycosyl-glycoprotein beta-1,6-N-acetylglucosaminyltransferase n=1 Tax=Batillaria attramentaria TaxID=370345 RepID=A0ABD0KQA8_9CAEN